MSLFKQRALSNGLTKLIENTPDVELETVLLHQDLSSTIRNESDILYKRVLRNDKKSWFYNIVGYALFDKSPPQNFKNLNKVNQINHNAANFLENCGKKFISYFKKDSDDQSVMKSQNLQSYLNEIIFNFIDDKNKKKYNSMCAGHFQRFVENFLRHQAFKQDETINFLTKFLVNNCKMLAYQQLIARILGDFSGTVNDNTTYCLLSQVLQRSCIAVKYVRSKKNLNQSETALYTSMRSNKSQNINDLTQPLNLLKKPIPLAGDFLNILKTNEEIHNLNESENPPIIPWSANYPQIDESEVKYSNVEDAELEAYLLIMSLRTSVYDQTDLIEQFREKDSQRGFPLIQALLFCGTRSGVKSLVSLEAFRLLSIIFNGSVSYSIDSWKSSEEEKSKLDFYTRYADEMYFSPDCITYQMIHALPVFWNHRYNKDDYTKSREESEIINVSDYYNDGNDKHYREREEGETALEILQPCLFCEPAISSQLIFAAIDIFTQLSMERSKLLDIEPRTKEVSDSMVRIDGIMLDFYQHHFIFGKEFPDATLSKLVSKNIIVPLPPVNEYYYKVEDHRRRTSLSGFVIDFFLKISMPSNPFFVVKKGENLKNPYSKMMHRPCFTCNNITTFIDYKFLSNFELLDKNTIYNLPVHNEFFFDDDDIEQEPNDGEKMTPVKYKIIVDELSSSSKSLRVKRGRKGNKKGSNNNDNGNNNGNGNENDNGGGDDDDDDEFPAPKEGSKSTRIKK